MDDAKAKAKSATKPASPVPAPRRGGGQLPSWKERHAAGKGRRERRDLDSHAALRAPSHRMDRVQMVPAAEKGHVPELLPLRHGRCSDRALPQRPCSAVLVTMAS